MGTAKSSDFPALTQSYRAHAPSGLESSVRTIKRSDQGQECGFRIRFGNSYSLGSRSRKEGRQPQGFPPDQGQSPQFQDSPTPPVALVRPSPTAGSSGCCPTHRAASWDPCVAGAKVGTQGKPHVWKQKQDWRRDANPFFSAEGPVREGKRG